MTEVHKEQNLTARQRGQKGRSGAEAAKVIRGNGPAPEQKRRVVQSHPQTASHYNTPSEFLAGPSKPGRVNKGIRRFEASDHDQVRQMLTDEYIMSGNGVRARGANKPKVQPCNRSGLTLSCQVTAEEEPFRTGHKITQPPAPMDAPYFEDNDPKPPRDTEAVHGKRHVKPKAREQQIFLTPGEKEEGADAAPAHSVTRTNKANQSRDVINLAQYSAEELHEPPQREMLLGPRKFVAPDMPPRRPPAIHQINGRAKDEHDVLGDGRFGKAEVAPHEGKALGSCRPPKQQANLFAGGAPAHVHKSAEKPAPKVQKNNILRYYDPNMDSAQDFGAAAKQRRMGNRANQETSNQPQAQPRRGRGLGECSKSRDTKLW